MLVELYQRPRHQSIEDGAPISTENVYGQLTGLFNKYFGYIKKDKIRPNCWNLRLQNGETGERVRVLQTLLDVHNAVSVQYTVVPLQPNSKIMRIGPLDGNPSSPDTTALERITNLIRDALPYR